MSTAQQELQKEAVAVSKWWRKNAEIRHGHLPYPQEAADVDKVTSPPGKDSSRSKLGPLAKGLLAAALATGAGSAAYFLWPKDTLTNPPSDQSLLQHLEDEGYNVPE